jgi:futalosine hydrolase
MRALIVTATSLEIAPLLSKLQNNDDLDVLVTGVGMVATAASCSRALAEQRYDVAFNFGLCGSFDPAIVPGVVVHVVSDRLSELGAEDGDAFLTIEELALPTEHLFVNPAPPANAALSRLPMVTGITVNTVHGNARSIAEVALRFAPQVESMEGAAFMCACLLHGVAFAQVRAVSNIVEQRNREAWKMAEAITNLAETALAILHHA